MGEIQRTNRELGVLAAIEFFKITDVATANGGFFVSAGGGTANVAAGIISKKCNIEYDVAHEILDWCGGQDWYGDLFWANGGPSAIEHAEDFRWCIASIAKLAWLRALT